MAKQDYDPDVIVKRELEPGRFRAIVTKVEKTLSSKNMPMLVWHWKIVYGTANGEEICSYTSLLDAASYNLKEHLVAFGYSGVVDIDNKDLVGKYATIVVAGGGQKAGQKFLSVTKVLPDE